MNIAIDQEKCCSAGTCVMLAPDVFDQRDDDGIVLLLDARPAQELHELARESADMCPAGAIYVTEGA